MDPGQPFAPEWDKAEHALSGFVLGQTAAAQPWPSYAGATPMQRKLQTMAEIAVAAASKELLDSLDRKHHTPDALDAVATFSAGAAGALGWPAYPIIDRTAVAIGVAIHF